MNQPNPVEGDLNATITAAVNARVEAAVLAAFSGDGTLGRYVTAALQRPVEVPDPDRSYGKRKVPFAHHLIEQAIRDAAKAAVQKVLTEDAALIEDEVRKHIKRAAPDIAARMVGAVSDVAAKGYGIQVSLRTGA